MASVDLTVIIPTQGRDTLWQMLGTVPVTGGPDRIIVCIDSHKMGDDDVDTLSGAITLAHPLAIAVTHDAEHSCWGHCQTNYAMVWAREHWPNTWFVYNDDDDAFTPDAFDIIRGAIGKGHKRIPHIFQFHTHWDSVLPPRASKIKENYVGGHCLVQPCDDDRLCGLTCRYNGDWDMIQSVMEEYDNQFVFTEQVIARCRPWA